MTTKYCLSTAPSKELHQTNAETDAMAQFQSALDACVHGWHHGNEVVALQSNIKELFGDMLMQYFERSLIAQVGQPVSFTFTDSVNGSQTFVQMPKNSNDHFHHQMLPNGANSPAQISLQSANHLDNTSIGVKKAPRPMNCWIIFRDAMHKKLKAENPNLTVQQISTRCSQMWHNLSPTEKKPWQAAAKSAKEEHLRVHPDYKYSPRKPGEKKKRQPRKAKQTPNFDAGPSFLDLSPVPQLTERAHNHVGLLTALDTPPLADQELVGCGNTFTDDTAQMVKPMTTPGTEMEDPGHVDYLHDSESVRHDRLEAEFGQDFEEIMPFDMFGEDTFVFRAGAEGNSMLQQHHLWPCR